MMIQSQTGRFSCVVAELNEWQHERALRERNYFVNFHQLHTMLQVELEATVVRDVTRLVAQVRDMLRTRHMLDARFV